MRALLDPAVELGLAHVVNVLMVVLVAVTIMRAGPTDRHVHLRLALLGLFVIADATALLWFDCSLRAIGSVALASCVASLAFPDGQTRPLGRRLGGARFPLYVASIFTLATLVYVHLPIATLLTSPGEIGIQLQALIATNGESAMIVTYAASLLYAFAPSPRMKTLLAFLSALAAALGFIYAFAYPFGYPMMNGLIFEQVPLTASALALRTCADVATVAAVAFLVLFSMERAPIRLVGGFVLLNVSLAIASGLRVSQDAEERAPSLLADAETAPRAHSGSEARGDALLRFGRGKPNVLIIFLDRFMGGFVERILTAEPQLRAELDGFTWYPRSIAAGENTIAGLHPLLGGYDYTPREMNTRSQALRDTAAESFAILPYNFTKRGYSANFVNPYNGFETPGDCTSLHVDGLTCRRIPTNVPARIAGRYGIPTSVLAGSSYADLLKLLGAMRVTPYGLREVLHRRGAWRPFVDQAAGTGFKEWAELKALPDLSSADSDRSNLDVVFNSLPHRPYFIGEDCTPRSLHLDLSDEDARRRGFTTLNELQHFTAARCALLLIADYLRWMESAGVYDDTRVVIVSDHGVVGPVEDRSSRAIAGGTTDNIYVRSRSLLLVKKRYAHGALRVSEEFTPNAEVPRIVCEEIGGCVNPYLGNKPIAALGRDKPFYVSFVPWQAAMQERMSFKILSEMAVVDRDPYDKNGWIQVEARR